MKSALTVLALTLLAACGRPVSEDKTQVASEPQSTAVGVRPLAEYEDMDTIILSFPLIEDAKGSEFREEYSKMMQAFLNESNARISFYTVYRGNGAERFYEYFPELLTFSSRIDIRPVYDEFIDFTIADGDDFGTWMRDASPIPGIDLASGKPILFDPQYGAKDEVPLADSIPLHFGKDTGLDIIDIPMKLEGGNFMTTTKGVCAISYGISGKNIGEMSPADRDKILMEKMGCKSIIFLEEIPGAIAHSDMIAKFLDDSTVAITEFSSNQIYFDGKISLCPSGLLGENCVDADWNRPAGLYDAKELGDWLVTEAAKRMPGTLNEKIGYEGENLFSKGQDAVSLSEISKTWRKQFEDQGFRVVGLPTPAPKVTFYVTSSKGRVWMSSDMEYVTYANALIFDKKIFVPSYQYDDRIKAANPLALEAYRAAGWDVKPVETNALTIGREGSVHCMSMSVRTH